MNYVLASNNYGVDYKPLMDWYAFQVADITHALQQPAGRKVSLKLVICLCWFRQPKLGSGKLYVKLHHVVPALTISISNNHNHKNL